MRETGYPSKDRIHLKNIPRALLHPRIPICSMLVLFEKINKGHMDEIAIITKKRQYTKQEIADGARQLAQAMLYTGIKPGQKIVLITNNCVEGIMLQLAANAIGVAVALLDPLSEPKTVLADIRLHSPVAAVFSTTKAVLYELASKRPAINSLYLIDQKTAKYPRFLTFDEFMQLGKHGSENKTKRSILRNILNNKPLLFLQTSGSTSGKPKVLPFTNQAICASLIYASNSTGTKTRDKSVNRVLCLAPYQHGYGWMPLFVNLIGGNTVILAPGVTPKDIGQYYIFQPSYIYGSPLILKHFMEETPEDVDLSFLVAFFCSGFAIPEEWFKEAEEYFSRHGSQAEIRNNYGISEGLCIGTFSDGIPHKPGTSGKFYVGPEWLIVDEDLNEVKYEQPGELIVAAKSLCQGYFGDPVATKEAFISRGGKVFYRTGDYVSLARDGYVSFLGRKKRFFQPIGVADKVNCEDIEHALTSSELVENCAVVVARDAKGIEGAKAFIVPSSPKDPSKMEAEIRQTIAKVLRDYQMPREIVFIDDLPLLNSGKIDYKKLETM